MVELRRANRYIRGLENEDLNRIYLDHDFTKMSSKEKLDNALAVIEVAKLLQEIEAENQEAVTKSFIPHSGTTEASTTTLTPEISASNMHFRDEVGANAYVVDATEDSTRCLEDTPEMELTKFFERPVKIAEYRWATGTALTETLNPWDEFLSNKRVINRIANYNLLRAKLHIRIVLNGNGFQYGRAIAAYQPLEAYDDFAPTTFISQDVTQLSQLPHVYLNPTTSQGGEMILPFFYHYNSLWQSNSQYVDIGTMYFRSLNSLKHANGADDKVSISVFAWAENMQLAVPTTDPNAGLVPQSGNMTEVEEANMKGFISGPATAVAKMAGKLETIPVIAPYAKATNIATSTIAEVSKALGYCRPPVTKNPEPYRPVPISSLANTNVPDTVNKLTVDDQQELTIDTRISGVDGGDSMNIRSVATRESWLTTFSWALGTAPDTLLFNVRPSPVLWNEVGTPTSYHFPACAMAALPFKYWAGSMKFRFQIVCSNYHKGRLRIAYDPNFFETGTLGEFNLNHMHIVDIAENNDFTITVNNGQNRTLLEHLRPGLDSATEGYSTTQYASLGTGNGVLAVSVLNELTVPNTTVNNDISINVFVSAGDDFEVFVPDDHFQAFTFKPQAGNMPAAMDKTMLDSQPLVGNQEHEVNGGTGGNSDLVSLVYTGESIKSFRTMLKRYNLHHSMGILDTSNNLVSHTWCSYPYLRGNVAGAVDQTSILAPYNYANTVLLHWVTMAFAGFRGGIRWKILPRMDHVYLTGYYQRKPPGGSLFVRDVSFNPAYNTQFQAAESVVYETGNNLSLDKYPTGVKGQCYIHGDINPTAELEVPFYSPARFVPGRRENWTTNSALDFVESVDSRVLLDSYTKSATLDYHCAIGEDFNTFFFIGLPRMYFEPAPPAPLAT